MDAARRPVVSSAYVAAVQSEMIEPSVTRAARVAGTRKIYAWTVNDPAKIRRVANHGVDGIVTDEPELATATVRAMRQMCGGGGGTETSGKPKRSDASLSRSRDDSRARTRWEGRRTSPGWRHGGES